MQSLEQIKQAVAENIKVFDEKFATILKSPVPLLNVVLRYVVRNKGKQMRPIIVFLSAKIFGEITEKVYRAASFIELMHTATLVHDDVVDDAEKRRGLWSVKAIWKNKVAVLTGDYLLSRGLLLALENKDYELLEIISTSVKEMSEGELLQLEKARKLDVNENIYFDIIRKKTASLIASCCAAGAMAAGASDESVAKMKLMGEYAGIAFQIKDDLLDYEKSSQSGKKSFSDLKEKKLTLPLIYMLNQISESEKNLLKARIKINGSSDKTILKVLNKIEKSGGLEYAQSKMLEFRQKAIELLDEMPENIYSESFRNLLFFITERNK